MIPPVSERTPAAGPSSPHVRGNREVWGLWERLVPDQINDGDTAGKRLRALHLERYVTAQSYVAGKRVLDLACGTGYGAQMLKEAGAASVTGVDLSPVAVEYARKHYQMPGVEYRVGDAEEYTDPEPYDTVVSFETIEHLRRPGAFLQRVRELLRPNGTLLLSVPIGESRHLDNYHLHTFSVKAVFALLAKTGFEPQARRFDDWRVSLRELLTWQKLYPESKMPLKHLFGTWRGRRLLWDLVVRRRVAIPMLLIAATSSAHVPCTVSQTARLNWRTLGPS